MRGSMGPTLPSQNRRLDADPAYSLLPKSAVFCVARGGVLGAARWNQPPEIHTGLGGGAAPYTFHGTLLVTEYVL